MAFNSVDYLIFLAVAFAASWALVRAPAWRLWLLLGASYLFYSVWNGGLVLLIVLSSAVDYLCGAMIGRARARGQRFLPEAWLGVSLVANLGLLGTFKYANFFLENARAALELAGVAVAPDGFAPLDLILPVGISFYTFQSLSYTFDIYKGELAPARSARDFFLFVAFFPQLIAGPIVRAKELLPQLTLPPQLDREQVTFAMYRLTRGLAKKMVIADYLAATVVDPTFQAPEVHGPVGTFAALVAFHFQVYCDFSGYTDIAIGPAALFGLVLPENFDRPYAAHTPSNYWRRWHMTLSRFCFDYLYAPLGGGRRSEPRVYLNTLITFAVIGFWHGASWGYVLFGVYHALAVIGTRAVLGTLARLRGTARSQLEARLAGNPLAILLTNLVIIGSLPLFRAPDLSTAWTVYAGLWPFAGPPSAAWLRDLPDALGLTQVPFPPAALGVLGLAVLSHFVPDRIEVAAVRRVGALHPLTQAALLAIVTTGVLHMATLAQQSFVYFQF